MRRASSSGRLAVGDREALARRPLGLDRQRGERQGQHGIELHAGGAELAGREPGLDQTIEGGQPAPVTANARHAARRHPQAAAHPSGPQQARHAGEISHQLEVDLGGGPRGGAVLDVDGQAVDGDVGDEHVAQDQVVGDRLWVRRALSGKQSEQQPPGG